MQFLLRDVEDVKRLQTLFPEIPHLGGDIPPDVNTGVPNSPVPDLDMIPRVEKRARTSSEPSTPRPTIYRRLDDDDQHPPTPIPIHTPGPSSSNTNADDDTISSEEFDDKHFDLYEQEFITEEDYNSQFHLHLEPPKQLQLDDLVRDDYLTCATTIPNDPEDFLELYIERDLVHWCTKCYRKVNS